MTIAKDTWPGVLRKLRTTACQGDIDPSFNKKNLLLSPPRNPQIFLSIPATS